MVNLKGLMMILELHRQGLPISVIAQRTGHDRKTVRKDIQQGLAVPKYKPRAARAGALDDFRGYLQERLQAESAARTSMSMISRRVYALPLFVTQRIFDASLP